jgi:hypothetical protein
MKNDEKIGRCSGDNSLGLLGVFNFHKDDIKKNRMKL